MVRQLVIRLLGAYVKVGVWFEIRDDRLMENKQLQSIGIDCKVGIVYLSIKVDLNFNIGIIFFLFLFIVIQVFDFYCYVYR